MADEIKIVGLSNTKAKGKTNWKVISAIIGIIVLSVGVIAGILLVRQQQDIREKAAECSLGGGVCPDPSNPSLLRDCSQTGEIYPNDSLCDTPGRVEICGSNQANAKQYCCPLAGGSWTADLSACNVAPTATATARATSTSSSSTGSFTDVPTNHWAYTQIEAIYKAGLTTGCSTNPLAYCPDNETSRAEMAVFLLKAKNGSSYTPPAATGTVFTDVPTNHWAAGWIEQLSKLGITSGCGNGNYCPDTPVKRSEMAVFLLKTKNGSSYTPPAATGTVFTDVPTNHWAAGWIEQLSADGITTGCSQGKYCPEDSVTRAQMAVFLANAFNIKTATQATATANATVRATATATTRATATATSGTQATATATTRATATATTRATATSGANKTATAKSTTSGSTSGSTSTPFPVPETGADLPTVLGLSFGVVMILISLGLAL